MKTKECKTCGIPKPLGEFPKHWNYKNQRLQTGEKVYYFGQICKDCKLKKRRTPEAQLHKKQIDAQRYQLKKREIIAQTGAYQQQPHRKEIDKKRHAKRWQDNKIDIQAERQKRFEQNPELRERVRECSRNHYSKNKWMYLARSNNRRAYKIDATPEWADLEKIKEIYFNRPDGYHVDHIIPLKSEIVCGLHVPENLQYLHAYTNRSKGNKFNSMEFAT